MTDELSLPEHDEVILADNMAVLPRIAEGSFQLIYIDPPFNTGKKQSRKTLQTVEDSGGDRTGFGGRRYTTRLLAESSYHDAFDDYLSFLEPRLRQAHRLLASSGTFYWQPAAGFLGRYRIVFASATERISVRVVVVP